MSHSNRIPEIILIKSRLLEGNFWIVKNKFFTQVGILLEKKGLKCIWKKNLADRTII